MIVVVAVAAAVVVAAVVVVAVVVVVVVFVVVVTAVVSIIVVAAVQSVCHFRYSDFDSEISFGDMSRTSLFFLIVSRYHRTSLLLLAASE